MKFFAAASVLAAAGAAVAAPAEVAVPSVADAAIAQGSNVADAAVPGVANVAAKRTEVAVPGIADVSLKRGLTEVAVPAIADVTVKRDAQLSLDPLLKCIDPVLDVLIAELRGLSNGQIVQIETGIQQGKPLQEVVGVATGLIHVVTNVVACLGNGLGDVDEELKQLLSIVLRALQL